MKIRHYIYSCALLLATLLPMMSCTDDIKFGNSFLEKAPGGDVTSDTIFSSALYTEYFLNGIYSEQYYGISYAYGHQNCSSGWTGKFDALTDILQTYYSGTAVYAQYYIGALSASESYNVFEWDGEYVWETIRACLILLENLDDVPDLDDETRERWRAETYCLMATRYFDLFQFFGGLPIIEEPFTGAETSYYTPRATVAETVDYMVGLLDKALAIEELPWAYEDDEAETETGHWTRAGAMALKCRIYAFVAAPLFNSSTGYYGGTSEAEQELVTWLGGYKSEYWDYLKEACEDLLDEIDQKGFYKLLEPSDLNSAWTDPTPEQYRLAYRRAYLWEGSPEILHSVRVTTTYSSKMNWYTWVSNGRNSYNPSHEYIVKFPWADGTPFDWDEVTKGGTAYDLDESEMSLEDGEVTYANTRLDTMYFKGDIDDDHSLTNITLTRDPRLYESCYTTGTPVSLGWSTGVMSGYCTETWIGGYDVGTKAETEASTSQFATGYFTRKFILNRSGNSGDASGLYMQWPTLRLADIYLLYAEALLQTGNNTKALTYINKVRARVGLGKLEEMDTRYDYASDSDALLEELLDERAREFCMENQRYFDLVRYKRADIFETQLHRVEMYRLTQLDNGSWGDFGYNSSTETLGTTKWYGGDTSLDFPTHFRYSVMEITNPVRYWWTYGYDPKWYLHPIPTEELNKDYGLIQNPGW